MPFTPEDKAREVIDRLLTESGWQVQNRERVDLSAICVVVITLFPMKRGFGAADYILFVDGMACGVVEAKREGATLTHVEIQTQRYSEGLPDDLPAPRKPLPFCYQSTEVADDTNSGTTTGASVRTESLASHWQYFVRRRRRLLGCHPG